MKPIPNLFAIGLCLFSLSALYVYRGAAQHPPARPAGGGFNSSEPRPTEDPVMVAHGKTLYGINCQACHGSDLRGGDLGGPNLLRSAVALSDRHGEQIVPIIQGGRQTQGMPKIGISIEDSDAVAAYVRSVIGTIGRQGTPPGGAKQLNIIVGDPHRGQVYFAAHCASCHSPEGDLHGIGSKFTDPKALQASWISGQPPRGTTTDLGKPIATVTTASGQHVSGTLVHHDDFLITLVTDDGTTRSFRKLGNTPGIAIHDPAQAHRDMLPLYTDSDVHDVTAYLVTLQ